MVDSQQESIVAVIENTRAGEGVTLPSVAVASGNLRGGTMVDSQVESHGTIATDGISTDESMREILRRSDVRMLIPVVGVACSSHGVASVAAIDGEYQCF